MNRLKELRKEKGFTQDDLAELLEVTKSTIHNWEKDVFSIKSDRLKKLCEIFDVDVPYLLGYNTVKNETDIKAAGAAAFACRRHSDHNADRQGRNKRKSDKDRGRRA